MGGWNELLFKDPSNSRNGKTLLAVGEDRIPFSCRFFGMFVTEEWAAFGAVALGKRRNFPWEGWPLPGCGIVLTCPLSPPRDLKRDVAKKLEKLEKRTQRAIAELIRAFRGRGGISRGISRGNFQRDSMIHAGSSLSQGGIGGVGSLPRSIWEAVGPKELPQEAPGAPGLSQGKAVGSLTPNPTPPSLLHGFSPAGERLKGQEEELASAVGSAKQEGSDSD